MDTSIFESPTIQNKSAYAYSKLRYSDKFDSMLRKCLFDKFKGKTSDDDTTLIRCAGVTTSVNASSDATHNETALPTPIVIIKTLHEQIDEEIERALALDLHSYPRYKRNLPGKKIII